MNPFRAATVATADLDRIEWPWLALPVHRDGLLYWSARNVPLRSPQGTLFELVENRP
jgi:hypothetical protein